MSLKYPSIIHHKMTPQEKAAQLVVDNQIKIRLLDYREAVECAKVIVDEIIESRKEDNKFDDTIFSTAAKYWTAHPMYLNYWLEVKQVLEKL